MQLLDPNLGSPVKSWRFQGESEISIGRSESCAVELLDSHVSRLHASLTLRSGTWVLTSRGRNGVFIDGCPISAVDVHDNLTFRLGPYGPNLRFNLEVESKNDFLQTLSFDPETMPFYQLDEVKLESEVSQITNEDFFQSLQRRAKQLRLRRKEV